MKFITLLITLLLWITAQSTIVAQADYVWAKQGGNANFVNGNIVTVSDGTGFIAAGDFLETATFDGEDIVSEGSTDIFTARFDDAGNLQQLFRIGSENEELLKFMDTDSEGNIILSILFSDHINIEGTDFNSYGGMDILILKYTPQFNLVWTRHFGTALTDYVKGMVVDNAGNILFLGKFKNEMTFGDFTLTSAGSTDICVVKISPQGEVLFAFNEGGDSYEDANAIATGNGNIFISGTFYGETVVNGQTLTTENTTGVYLAKYSGSGDFQWVNLIDGTKLGSSAFLQADNEGDIYISGNFQDKIVFGNTTLTTGPYDQDVYLAKYNSSGQPLWAAQGHSSTGDMITAMGTDTGGNVYLAGYFLSTIDFNGVILNYTLC